MADRDLVESLKQISSNLETINKTLKKDKNEAIDTNAWKEQIEKIINFVDSQCKKKCLTPYRLVVIVAVMIPVVIGGILMILLNETIISVVLSYATTFPTTDAQLKFLVEQLPSVANLTTGVMAVLVALWAIAVSGHIRLSTADELAKWNYDVLSKKPEVAVNVDHTSKH